MKLTLFTFFLLTTLFAHAQNVGIGTTTPSTKLHVLGPDAGSSNTTVTVDNASTTASSAINLSTAGATADFTRFGGSSGGSSFGVASANLARLYNSGPILVGASG